MAEDPSARLNAEQLAAVEAQERAIAVLAGPGSGKTRVLSYRARHLLRKNPSDRALLLTFTNKAAAEMKARATDVSAVPSRRLHACNFHTFGADLLRLHGKHVRVAPSFEILDDEEATALQNSIGGDAYANYGRRWSSARLRRQSAPPPVQVFGELYEAEKRRRCVVDFDDLVVCAAELFEQRDDIAAAYASRFKHLLIDEFQDTNAAQFEIVSALSKHASTVSIFADDDQAIYGFAGADLAHIRRFVEDLGAKHYPLTMNYRCRSEIVERANRLLEADPSASTRRMKSAYAGGSVTSKAFSTLDQEARWVSADVQETIAAGTSPDSIGVLVRSRFRAKEVSYHLSSMGIPVSDWLGDRYSKDARRALRTCLAVVRKDLSERQRENLSKLYELPMGSDPDTTKFLLAHRERKGVSELIEVHRRVLAGTSVEEVLARVQVSLKCINPDLAASLDSVIDSIKAFQAYDAEFTLEHLLNELALGGGGGSPTAGGGVKLATLHRTKGLQWPHVYLLGLEAETLPDFRASGEDDVRAERRVCFVGVCRAEKRLVLTRVENIAGHWRGPSIFLREMDLT